MPVDPNKLYFNLYFCDPSKRPCRHLKGCYVNNGPCRMTKDPADALLDSSGEPILVMAGTEQAEIEILRGPEALQEALDRALEDVISKYI